MRRNAVHALLLLFPMTFGSLATVQPAMSAEVHHVSARPDRMDILPTLKGHMAHLGALMNFLFRNIDEEDQRDELIAVAREMDEHLRRSTHFEPLSLDLIIDPAEYAKARKAYRKCIRVTRQLTAELEQSLSGSGAQTPRQVLLRLDRKRRDCHAAFG